MTAPEPETRDRRHAIDTSGAVECTAGGRSAIELGHTVGSLVAEGYVRTLAAFVFRTDSLIALAIFLVIVGGLGVVYSYFLYPVVLLLLPDCRVPSGATEPVPATLTLIVAARNELQRVRSKLQECLALREVCKNLEILVASDASNDGTDDIVREFAASGVQLIRTAERLGKENAQLDAIRAAAGDILIFTDTGTTIVPASIARIAELFRDASIGAVSSTDRVIDEQGRVNGESMYIRYEMWLRDLESRKGGLIGLSGSFFAARREVCRDWSTDVPSDFSVAMMAGQLGLRAVSDRDVIGEYRNSRNPDHEFARKTRTIIRGMAAIGKRRKMLNPFRFGRLAFQLWSHKILRWMVPWFAMLYVVGSVLLVPVFASIAYGLLVPAAVLLAIAAIAAVKPELRRVSAVGAAYFFVQVNLAAMVASLQYLAGRRVTMWAPTTR